MPTIRQTHFDCLPPGNYPARIAAVELVKGKFGDQVRVKFDLVGDLSGRSVTGWASASFGGRSKLTDWVRAALFDGAAVPESYDLNTDDLVNRRVIVTLIERAGDSGETFNKVDAVKPARGIGPQPRPGGGMRTNTNGGSHPEDAPDWPGWPAATTPPNQF